MTLTRIKMSLICFLIVFSFEFFTGFYDFKLIFFLELLIGRTFKLEIEI